MKVRYQSRLDSYFSGVRSIRRIVELRLIRDTAAPSLSATKSRSPVRLPKHRRRPIHDRAHEVPLPTTEVPGARKENNPLIEPAKLDAKPAFVFAAHFGTNNTAGHLSPVGMRPDNPTYANVGTALDKAPLG